MKLKEVNERLTALAAMPGVAVIQSYRDRGGFPRSYDPETIEPQAAADLAAYLDKLAAFHNLGIQNAEGVEITEADHALVKEIFYDRTHIDNLTEDTFDNYTPVVQSVVAMRLFALVHNLPIIELGPAVNTWEAWCDRFRLLMERDFKPVAA